MAGKYPQARCRSHGRCDGQTDNQKFTKSQKNIIIINYLLFIFTIIVIAIFPVLCHPKYK